MSINTIDAQHACSNLPLPSNLAGSAWNALAALAGTAVIACHTRNWSLRCIIGAIPSLLG
jgi:hypothetical protein